jgi:hypothetical protein
MNLRVDLREVDSSGTRRLCLRRFEDSTGTGWMLLCDPHRLETQLGKAHDWKPTGRNLAAFDSSAWGHLHGQEARSGWKDAGIRHVPVPEKGIVLSVDLCPSHKPLNRTLVRSLLDAFRHEGKPIPVSFALSGGWIRTHGDDLAWLQGQVDSDSIDPTWVNHTNLHRYRKGVPDRKNFLFLPGTDILSEVLGAEIEMLRHGCVPSVFFRFPGLMDDSTLFAQVLATGLLPIGSDAWLAKNQNPKSGSIVLIHGNGNEPVGVHDFLKLLKTERSEIRTGHWHLEDLSEELDEFPDSPWVAPDAKKPAPQVRHRDN